MPGDGSVGGGGGEEMMKTMMVLPANLRYLKVSLKMIASGTYMPLQIWIISKRILEP